MTELKRIGIGTAQFGMHYGITNETGKTSEREVEEILRQAASYEIDTVDTAFAYGDSETVLGKQDLSRFRIVTKFSGIQDTKDLRKCLVESLQRLNVSSIHGYIAHGSDLILENQDIWQQCQELKRKGHIQKTGYSIYTPAELNKLLNRKMIPDLIQVPYSMVDRRFENCFEKLKALGTEIHVRSCFLQGVLFLPPDQLPQYFAPLKSFLGEFHTRYRSPEEQASAMIRFSLQNKSVDRVILGINDSEQLKQNFRLLNNPLNDTIWTPEDYEIPEDILLPNKWPAL